jgi:CheY-like chemotaxis protein
MMNTGIPFNLLLVDDSPADMRLMLEAARLGGLKDKALLHCAYDGEEALELLDAAYRLDTTFHMVLLDLNMPRMSGKELLRRIRLDTRFRQLPIFIMTNSDLRSDIEDCMRLGADAFFQKPHDFQRFIDFFSSLSETLDVEQRLSVDHMQQRFAELKKIG